MDMNTYIFIVVTAYVKLRVANNKYVRQKYMAFVLCNRLRCIVHIYICNLSLLEWIYIDIQPDDALGLSQ